ncbi:MAG: histidine phosphatase family protein [Gammaproteobacteria bacterium]|nr:histidine phosphatase family protein [Gammaproteobacteria bacterium]MDH3412986.1 histidine phosphatase family protein [Gammaproteobacteria bacterium]
MKPYLVMRDRFACISFFVILILLSIGGTAPAQEGKELSDEQLVGALRQGGYNIYFRHAATDWSQSDQVREAGDWTSCDPSRIRQLSDDGRETARAVGAAIRALRVPVGKVLASPYCRTAETASLMDLGQVETTIDVMNMRVADYFGGREAIVKTARARLAAKPAPGTNAVIVAHGNVARDSTPVYPGEAEGVVFLPDGNGGFSVVTRVSPERWVELAGKFSGD